ncbi:MAG: hypothetical protein INH37_18730 [Myxococcaceae bacterium]|nr:hypothetical protein [Myxococcaceae bacterium]
MVSASGLQEGAGMMVRVVAILAAVVVSGCGVGLEDPEGVAAAAPAGTAQQAMMGCTDAELCPELGATPRPVANPVAAPGGTIALPQDPIPWRPPMATPAERPFGPRGVPEPGVPRR